MAHQDWTPMVLKKPQPKSKGTPQVAPPKLKHSNVSVNMKRLDEDDAYVPPKMTRELGQKILQGRSKLKLSQEQLAMKCSIPLSILRDYERGIGVYNRIYLNPLCRFLDIALPKPKPPASTSS